MTKFIKSLSYLHRELEELYLPPEETKVVLNGQVIPFSVIKGTRGYLEKLTHQINATYKNSCYDACGVLIRRLVETLVIECFELNGFNHKIENANGDYFFLKDLIDVMLQQTWKLSRNFKRDIQKLKDVGDKSAHSKTYIANRQDIDDIIPSLRLVVQEMIILSGMKK